jgi:phospholipase A-2-activating protein
VKALANGDIVSGTNDGVVRVFTRSTDRFASEDKLRAYDDQVEKSTLQAYV